MTTNIDADFGERRGNNRGSGGQQRNNRVQGRGVGLVKRAAAERRPGQQGNNRVQGRGGGLVKRAAAAWHQHGQ